jgi:hypothetical protein
MVNGLSQIFRFWQIQVEIIYLGVYSVLGTLIVHEKCIGEMI